MWYSVKIIILDRDDIVMSGDYPDSQLLFDFFREQSYNTAQWFLPYHSTRSQWASFFKLGLMCGMHILKWFGNR